MSGGKENKIGGTGATLSMHQSSCKYYISEGSQCSAGGDRGPGARDGLCFTHDNIEDLDIPADMTNLPGDPVAEELTTRIATMIRECEATFVKASES